MEIRLIYKQYFSLFHTHQLKDRKMVDNQLIVHITMPLNNRNLLQKNVLHLLRFMVTCTRYCHKMSMTSVYII